MKFRANKLSVLVNVELFLCLLKELRYAGIDAISYQLSSSDVSRRLKGVGEFCQGVSLGSELCLREHNRPVEGGRGGK